MHKRHILAKPNAQHGTFAIIITALLTAFLILIFNTSCSKADEITPIATNTPASPNYALLDYQDTAHIAYAMRTDLLEYNNIYFQLKGGGHLLLYSFNHLNAEEPSDTIKLVTPENFAENHQGVVAIMQRRKRCPETPIPMPETCGFRDNLAFTPTLRVLHASIVIASFTVFWHYTIFPASPHIGISGFYAKTAPVKHIADLSIPSGSRRCATGAPAGSRFPAGLSTTWPCSRGSSMRRRAAP